MDGGAWGGYSPRGRKESDTTVQLHFQKRNKLLQEAVVSVRKDAHEAGNSDLISWNVCISKRQPSGP